MSRKIDIQQELEELNSLLAIYVGMPFNKYEVNFEEFYPDLWERMEKEGLTSSNLGKIPKENPLSVPENYFNELHSDILNAVKTDAFVGSLPVVMPYEVPMEYFDALPGEIISGIKTNEFLSSIPKHSPLLVPENYFAGLHTEILSKVNEEGNSAKRIPFANIKRKIAVQWAVAAMLLITIGISGYKFFFSQRQPQYELLLSNVTRTDINDYINQRSDILQLNISENNKDLESLNKQLDQVDNEDIKSYLDDTGWDAL